MKLLSILALSLATTLGCGGQANAEPSNVNCVEYTSDIFPPNDLDKEDNLFTEKARISEDLFNRIIDAASLEYKVDAAERGEKLLINKLWTDSTVNANASRNKKYCGQVTLNMYGGLARRPEVLPSSFAIVVCHELGHAYAGAPYVYEPTQLAAEGMADYYATRSCFDRIAKHVPELQEVGEYTEFINKTCDAKFSLISSGRDCKNGLAGGQGLANLLAFLTKEKAPNYETPDPYVTPETMLSYPKTVQCRLDSYRAGLFNEDRPLCWYKP